MIDLSSGDIAHFLNYFFTDAQKSSPNRFALVLLPAKLTRFVNNIYCCVITSQKPRFAPNTFLLNKNRYCCLTMNSFACFDRRDYECLTDLSEREQPVGELLKQDIPQIFKTLRFVLYRDKNINGLLRATIIREWKELRDK